MRGVKVDRRKLAEREGTYAAKLLTPLSQIIRDQTASSLVSLSSSPGSLAKRRYPCSVSVASEPLRLVTGVLDEDLLTVLYHFHYLTLSPFVKLLGPVSSVNHV